MTVPRAGFSSLPDQVLKEVFKHINIIERIKYERVCSRIRNVITTVFLEQKSLSVLHDPPVLHSIRFKKSNCLDVDPSNGQRSAVIKAVLIRTKNLRILYINALIDVITPELINNSCSSIEHLVVDTFVQAANIVKSLPDGRSLKVLEVIEENAREPFSENSFDANKINGLYLRGLTVRSKIPDEFLAKMLGVSYVYKTVGFDKLNQNLVRLDIERSLTEDDLKLIGSRFLQLKKLSICIQKIDHLAHLNQLNNLNFFVFDIKPTSNAKFSAMDLIKLMPANCNLTHLGFLMRKHFTDEEVKALADRWPKIHSFEAGFSGFTMAQRVMIKNTRNVMLFNHDLNEESVDTLLTLKKLQFIVVYNQNKSIMPPAVLTKLIKYGTESRKGFTIMRVDNKEWNGSPEDGLKGFKSLQFIYK